MSLHPRSIIIRFLSSCCCCYYYWHDLLLLPHTMCVVRTMSFTRYNGGSLRTRTIGADSTLSMLHDDRVPTTQRRREERSNRSGGWPEVSWRAPNDPLVLSPWGFRTGTSGAGAIGFHSGTTGFHTAVGDGFRYETSWPRTTTDVERATLPSKTSIDAWTTVCSSLYVDIHG